MFSPTPTPDPSLSEPPPLEPSSAQNVALFFPSPVPFSLFLSLSLKIFSWNFGGVSEKLGPSNVHVWALVLSCEADCETTKTPILAKIGLAKNWSQPCGCGCVSVVCMCVGVLVLVWVVRTALSPDRPPVGRPSGVSHDNPRTQMHI